MTTSDRLAIIEVGTRGIRLLVVARRPPPESMTVLKSMGDQGFLGEGLEANGNRMRPANIQRSLHLIHRFLEAAREHHAAETVLVGTEVFRRAVNVADLHSGLPRSLELRVLTPEEEAVGSFLAAAWGFRATLPDPSRLLVLDLGGGSLEIVSGTCGCPPTPQTYLSLGDMGTLTLQSVWQRGRSPAQCEELLQRHLRDAIAPHENALAALSLLDNGTAESGCLVAGLGSTVTDSAWVIAGRSRKKFSSSRVHGLCADTIQLAQLRELLLTPSRTMAEGLQIRDGQMHQLGLAALLEVMGRLNARTITACGTGLRFGLGYAFLHQVPLRVTQAPRPECETSVKPRAQEKSSFPIG